MSRYNPQGQTQVYWCTDTLTVDAPTVAEIAAGVRLDEMMVPDGMTGFTAEGSDVDVTDLAATAEKTVPGLAKITAGGIVFFRGDTAGDPEADLFDALTIDCDARTPGYIVVVLDGAPAAGKLADVLPASIKSLNADTPKGETGGRWTVGFSHPEQSKLNVAVAA